MLPQLCFSLLAKGKDFAVQNIHLGKAGKHFKLDKFLLKQLLTLHGLCQINFFYPKITVDALWIKISFFISYHLSINLTNFWGPPLGFIYFLCTILCILIEIHLLVKFPKGNFRFYNILYKKKLNIYFLYDKNVPFLLAFQVCDGKNSL